MDRGAWAGYNPKGYKDSDNRATENALLALVHRFCKVYSTWSDYRHAVATGMQLRILSPEYSHCNKEPDLICDVWQLTSF